MFWVLLHRHQRRPRTDWTRHCYNKAAAARCTGWGQGHHRRRCPWTSRKLRENPAWRRRWMTGCCDVVERYNMHENVRRKWTSSWCFDCITSQITQIHWPMDFCTSAKNDKCDMDDGQQDARMALHTIALMIKFWIVYHILHTTFYRN